MKILNVAEKNDAAKNIANILSSGKSRRLEGLSKYNKIYEFSCTILGGTHNMVMTSVSGHLLNVEFVGSYKKWSSCNPISLFDAPVFNYCPPESKPIKDTLEREVKKCSVLIIWTDCDREGENIGFEIISVCKAVKPDIKVYRAKFSEITATSIRRAASNLIDPNENVSLAVDVRKELDLRIGAAFTRFQTLRLQKLFPEHLNDSLISYGSCQFPTLGFVVERYKAIQEFITEPFWKIKVSHKYEFEGEATSVEFLWKRGRLFEQLPCQIIYELCLENPLATVINVATNPKSKWRPIALDTIEFEKLSSKKLKIPAKEAMRIAEKLYTQGIISYPRTETNIFPKELNLLALVSEQCQDNNWGRFSQNIVDRGGPTPRNGKKSDQAHPPIHPTKWTNGLTGDEKRVYELIVRHFLACCDQDAKGQETKVTVRIQDELFIGSGLCIIEYNYLDVYPYEKWNAKFIPNYQTGDSFTPDINMQQGETTPPSLLTEADLITLMEKHGIGTDATHAEHIETIKSRSYVGVQEDGKFLPGQLGMGLVEGYDSMGITMSKPDRRRDLEQALIEICNGNKNPKDILAQQVAVYKELFVKAVEQVSKIDQAISVYLGNPVEVAEYPELVLDPYISKCARCQVGDITLKSKANGSWYLSCMSYPQCRSVLWLPELVVQVTVLDTSCPQCQAKRVKLKFKKAALFPYYPDEYETCIICDQNLLEMLDLDSINSDKRNMQDSGYESTGTGITSNSSLKTASACLSQAGTNGNVRGSQVKNGKKIKPPDIKKSQSTSKGNVTSKLKKADRHTSIKQPEITTKCQCDLPTVVLTVRKEGPNTGRQFHKCGANTCNFFQWTEDPPNITGNTHISVPTPQVFLATPGRSEPPHLEHDEENPIVCNCSEVAMLLTVRKEGPNTGRQFYKCGKPQGTGCNFFLWADAQPNANQAAWPSSSDSNRDTRPREQVKVKCICGSVAKKLRVQKEGPNQGKEFYSCSKPRNTGCNFFQWVDEDNERLSTNKNNKSAGPVSETKKRKCGACGNTGHNRRNCPVKF